MLNLNEFKIKLTNYLADQKTSIGNRRLALEKEGLLTEDMKEILDNIGEAHTSYEDFLKNTHNYDLVGYGDNVYTINTKTGERVGTISLN